MFHVLTESIPCASMLYLTDNVRMVPGLMSCFYQITKVALEPIRQHQYHRFIFQDILNLWQENTHWHSNDTCQLIEKNRITTYFKSYTGYIICRTTNAIHKYTASGHFSACLSWLFLFPSLVRPLTSKPTKTTSKKAQNELKTFFCCLVAIAVRLFN